MISEPLPRFSFLHGALAGGAAFAVTQASYRITVTEADAASGAKRPVLWDSGDVKSSSCNEIVFAGVPLQPFTRYDWTAEWTASTGTKSAQANARFETGPMHPSDWQGAGWIGEDAAMDNIFAGAAAKQLRKKFELPSGKVVTTARVYVAAAGCSHVEVNGKVPQPDMRGICPWAVASGSIRYITHDATSLVTAGTNVLGLVAVAVGETVILPHTPLPFSRCFNMDGKGVSEK